MEAYGPKMQALTERQREFVHAMLEHPGASARQWAEMAGYRGGPEVLKVSGCRLRHDPAIMEACAEVVESCFKGAGALAIRALINIVEDPNHRWHFQACVALADRAGYAPIARQEIKVEHRDESGAAMMARIRELAAKHGLDAEKLLSGNAAPMIEARALPSRD